MSIQPVNSSVVPAVNASPYDPTQQDFLDALKAFEAALKAAEANPNDPILAEQLKEAGAALSKAQTALENGNAADKAMNTAFEADTLGGLNQLIADCASGNLTTVENDVYGLSQNPGVWGEIQEGLNTFNSAYPNS